MPTVGGVAKANNQRGKGHGNSCSAGNDAIGASAGTITFLTAPLFAKATKNTQSSAREQEEQFSDLLVLIRHGERQDHADRAWKGTALLPLYDPPISNAGRMQSFETALKYYALRQEKKIEQRIRGTFTMFLVSPFHRCIETAAVMNIIAFEGKLPMYVDPLLSDWQQAKVFRTAPLLGGVYVRHPDADIEDAHGDRLLFCPQLEALRATLVPFLKTRAAEASDLLAEYGISAEVAASWVGVGEQWLDSHATIPVWTSAAVTTSIVEKIEAQRTCTIPDAVGERTTCRRGGKGPLPPPSRDAGTGSAFKGCGVPHPEGKADLVRRCEQVVATHYLQSSPASSQSMVPRSIQHAAANERKTRLPKYFQTWAERPAEEREATGALALLPPMHVIAVTHADIVSTLLEVCCPKYHDKGAGYSVAYCSITALQRHNNFYRIPPLEERQRAEASANGRGTSQRCSKGYPKKKMTATPSKSQLTGLVKTRVPPPFSAEWTVESVGSTDLLRTRIVIQYSK
ncbi:hypothetical protein ABB37_07822 [Leptomonas pyrrhocoris]|uniref:Uncharacterized protein n=1 Tax=Leptomonas pyrrhocoris TaxID=157538 RepID=A0A0N0VDT5_LEPPY|nr:hypothetical protein ABB37_07822 [Leptomonas pyrrhocoris]KPA76528.1 hypothetical protein ABB37_07822 [Leptomonas pyrrhocoris]|eukprot:XP_015654967.1 hypothetical protein ABB37_07822 [Leptomonas pyrrhocoris]